MTHLPVLCFNIPRLEAPVFLKTRWRISLNRCTTLLSVQFHCPLIVGIATQLFFRFRTHKRPTSLQKFHAVIPDFLHSIVEHWWSLLLDVLCSRFSVESHCILTQRIPLEIFNLVFPSSVAAPGSSLAVMNSPGIPHSEFLQNVPLSTSE